jgi:hypothetical protein
MNEKREVMARIVNVAAYAARAAPFLTRPNEPVQPQSFPELMEKVKASE